MKKLIQLIVIAVLALIYMPQVTAQTSTDQGLTYRVQKPIAGAPLATVNLRELPDDWGFQLESSTWEAPEPGGMSHQALKAELHAKRLAQKHNQQATLYKKKAAADPVLGDNYQANSAQGTPNDNSMAISNDGMVVSVVNQSIRIYDQQGTQQFSRSLAFFAQPLGPLNRTFDPRAIYDPIEDRFIVMFLQGSNSQDSRIITAFSKTSDPLGEWNFYAIEGVLLPNAWTDYPIIGITRNELFITVNLLRDSMSWQEGFIESIIWQIDKGDGYRGDSLDRQYFDSIRYNGKSVWSVCPVQGGLEPHGPNMYFISMRPGDASNDTVFLHEITNTMASQSATLTTTVLKSDVAYGVPPSAFQPGGKELLQTNDARSLCAMIENDMIQFVGNTIDPSLNAPGVYHGVIRNVKSNPTISGDIISFDTLDIGYPSIAYAGGGASDNSAMITFSHSSENTFPGTSVIYVGRDLELSDPLRVKSGLGTINVLFDTLERWGDYTGIQAKYNELGVCWMAGSYGDVDGSHKTWIAEVTSTDPALSVKESPQVVREMTLYPNPASQKMTFDFVTEQTHTLGFSILDLQGREVKTFGQAKLLAGEHTVAFDVSQLNDGVYFLSVKDGNAFQQAQRFVVKH